MLGSRAGICKGKSSLERNEIGRHPVAFGFGSTLSDNEPVPIDEDNGKRAFEEPVSFCLALDGKRAGNDVIRAGSSEADEVFLLERIADIGRVALRPGPYFLAVLYVPYDCRPNDNDTDDAYED